MLATAVVAVSSQPALQPDGFLQSNSQWGRQWTVQPGGLNCYDGHGATGASAQPNSRSIRLDVCQQECRSLPGCGAVVVKFESSPDRKLAAAGKVAATAAALVDCYLREEVQAEDCVHGSTGSELYILGPRKVWQQENPQQYLTPKDVATCVSNNPRAIDSWCRNMCERGACTAEMCMCDGEANPSPAPAPAPVADADADRYDDEASNKGETSVKAQIHDPDAKEDESRPAQTRDRRIGWLHIPKAGTSFGTALAHLANDWALESNPSGVKRLPEDAQMKDCAVDKCKTAETREFAGRFPFAKHFPDVFWFPWGKQGRWGSHATLMTSTGWKEYRGHMFSMFREPSSLAASSIQYFGKARRSGYSLKEYSERVWGTTTSMINGQKTDGLECLGNPKRNRCPWAKGKEPDVARAIMRLDAFAFVGLTEEWSLSICLLHAQHGGKCRPVELANSRNTSSYWLADQAKDKAKDKAQAPVVDPTNATYDPYDGELFKAVQHRFWSDVKKAGLSRKECERSLEEQGCLQPAGAALTRLAQSRGSSPAGGRSDPED